tara:strand:- start:928 stop:1287 length:360 start_codon:yes stop_codon:yes gene_type:complete
MEHRINVINTHKNGLSKFGDGARNPRLFKRNDPKKGMLSRTLGRLVRIAHQKIIWSSRGTFLVISTYPVTSRLTSQLFESLSIPAKKPIRVAVIIPRLETKTVFKSPTIRARPNDDCEV